VGLNEDDGMLYGMSPESAGILECSAQAASWPPAGAGSASCGSKGGSQWIEEIRCNKGKTAGPVASELRR
jgi:hypothetical protein